MGEKKLDEVSNNSSDNENRDNVSEIKDLLKWFCEDYKNFAVVYRGFNDYSVDECKEKLKSLGMNQNATKRDIYNKIMNYVSDIEGKINNVDEIISNSYDIKHGYNANFVYSPYIAISKKGKEEFSGIQKGIYLVYLFDTTNKDKVFLTLSIGSGNPKLESIKESINKNFLKNAPNFDKYDASDLEGIENKGFCKGVVFYKEYYVENITDEEFYGDLKIWMKFFDENLPLFKSFYNGSTPPNSPQKPEDADSYLKTTLKVLEESKALILYGPPGSGKTRLAKIVADKVLAKIAADKVATNKDNIKLVQFHPSYSYDDFVRGMSIKTDDKNGIKYEIESKIIEKFCDGCTEKNPKVLIIDEINRAPLGSVLGELIYGLEYRGQPISTPYELKDKKTLTIPEDLYIIGTMNTADRSLDSLDYAVRRRFAFELVNSKPEPKSNTDRKKTYYKVKDTEKLFLNKLYDLVKADIEKSIVRDVSIEEIMPGTSYFLVNEKDNKPDIEHIKYKLMYELIPLLQDYAMNGLFAKKNKIECCGSEDYLVNLLKGKAEEIPYLKKCYGKICEKIEEEKVQKGGAGS